MNAQVQRLEELLVRIERNRRYPRKPLGVNIPAMTAEQAVAAREVSPKPVPATASDSRPQTEHVQVSPKTEVAQAIAPQAPKTAEPVQPVVVVPAAVVLPVHAVAKVVSEVAKIDEPTFGQLLRRSLSLRPS